MSSRPPIGLYTLDVGHGLCQLLLLQGRRAVLVDGGSFSSRVVAATFLDQFVDWIELYIATHNDSDHIGAAMSLLDRPRYRVAGAFRRALVLVDRPSPFPVPLISYLVQREDRGTLERLMFGYVSDDEEAVLKPKLVLADRNSSLRVKLLYPRFKHNLPATQRPSVSRLQTNRTSMVLKIDYGSVSALITGDADCESFCRIMDEYNFDLKADILTLPHHGGRIPGAGGTWDRVAGMISPKVVIASSGTVKTKVQDVSLQPFRVRKVPVCCTQITNGCHPTPGAFQPAVSSVSHLIGVPERSAGGGVACFGSSVAFLDEKSVSVLGLNEHQKAVETRVVPSGSPLCQARLKV